MDLLQGYSNQEWLLKRLQRILAEIHDQDIYHVPVRVVRNRQTQHRLSETEEAKLVARYQAGEKAYRLARDFRIHRNTVVAILERAGVQRRPRSMSSEQIQQAIELYGRGFSLAKIGKQLGFNHGTIWLALKAMGVRLRRPWEESGGGARR